MSYRLKIRNVCFNTITAIERVIPKDRRLILFTSWLGEKYIDNSKYVYEYLLGYKEYKAVWMTNNNQIYKVLKDNNKPVCKFHSLRGLWYQLRARVVFSSIQFADYNPWLVNRCLYIDLGHGHPIKDPGKEHFTDESRLIDSLILNKIDYYAIVASDFSKHLYTQVIDIPLNKILVSDFARNDVFVDASLRKGKNLCIERISGHYNKVVTYMPTHRRMGVSKMNMHSILPLDALQSFCKDNNVLFIIKKHFYHRDEKEKLDDYSNIIDITNVDDIDPQVLLYQSDVLITDYSACYIDYMLLNRPLLFYQYDIEDFTSNERSLYISFKDIDIAPVSFGQEDLIRDLKSVINEPSDLFEERRNEFAKTYFNNLHQEDGRKKVVDIMQRLLNETAK